MLRFVRSEIWDWGLAHGAVAARAEMRTRARRVQQRKRAAGCRKMLPNENKEKSAESVKRSKVILVV